MAGRWSVVVSGGQCGRRQVVPRPWEVSNYERMEDIENKCIMMCCITGFRCELCVSE